MHSWTSRILIWTPNWPQTTENTKPPDPGKRWPVSTSRLYLYNQLTRRRSLFRIETRHQGDVTRYWAGAGAPRAPGPKGAWVPKGPWALRALGPKGPYIILNNLFKKMINCALESNHWLPRDPPILVTTQAYIKTRTTRALSRASSSIIIIDYR